MTPTLGAVIVAAGSGQRFGDPDKVLTLLAGLPILTYSLRAFDGVPGVAQVVVVAGEHSIDRVREIAAEVLPGVHVCLGGATRQESVLNGLAALDGSVDLVAVHDGARPLVSSALIQEVLAAALDCGAAVPALPLSDTLYRVDERGEAFSIEDRERLRTVQTPQIARRDWLMAALSASVGYTDEGSALLAFGLSVRIVSGCPENIKITWPADLERANEILSRRAAACE